MDGPRLGDAGTEERVKKLLALEIARIIDDMRVRRDFLVKQWGVHRQRWPFLDTAYSRWTTLGLPELVRLDVTLTLELDHFYRKLEEFRLYFTFTEDMPTHLGDRYDKMFEVLQARGEAVIESLGGVPDYPLGFDDTPDEDLWEMAIEVPDQDQTGPRTPEDEP